MLRRKTNQMKRAKPLIDMYTTPGRQFIEKRNNENLVILLFYASAIYNFISTRKNYFLTLIFLYSSIAFDLFISAIKCSR